MTTAPYPWIQRIEDALQEIKEIPLWGAPPSFPWEQLSFDLGERIQLKNLSISFHKTEWKSQEELLSGLGSKPIISGLELSPLSGEAFWVMAQEDVAKLIAALLPTTQRGFSDPRLQEGFYRYLCLEAIDAINQLNPFGDLNIKLSESTSLPQEGCFCIDVSLKFNQHPIWGRIVCPSSFHNSFKSYFGQKRVSPFASDSAKQIEVPLSLEVAHAKISLEDWKKVRVGDCLLLDKSSFDAKTNQGMLTICLNKHPLFQAKCKDGHVKILDYAYYYEEEIPMDTLPPFEDEPEKEEEEEDELPEEEEMLNEELFLDKELQEEVKSEEEPLWTAKPESEAPEHMVSAEEVPLTITVEVGKLMITLDKVLQMQPGNVIELSTKPEQGVSLTVGGKKIAHGELVMIGEVLGVKILQIGKA